MGLKKLKAFYQRSRENRLQVLTILGLIVFPGVTLITLYCYFTMSL